MDVNVNTELKGLGVPTMPAVERENREKTQVAPVEKGGDSSKAALDQRMLRERKAEEQRAKISAEEAAEAVKEMQERLDSIGNTRLHFTLSKNPEAVVVQITDRKSGEIIKQFPAEEALALRRKLEELVGLLFDEKA